MTLALHLPEQRPKILVVDDIAANLLAMQTLLENVEADLLLAASGDAALETLLNEPEAPALALVDVQMPGMNGFELVQLLRLHARTRSMPIIFVSAVYQDTEHIDFGYQAGAVDFIVKPLNQMMLLSKVRVFLDLHRQRQEAVRSENVHRALQLRAESANFAKSQFLAAMSHEIRTPMNAVLGMAQVLVMPDVTEADRIDYAGTILASGQTLLKLLNDILDLAKIEAGKIELESISLSPEKLLEQVSTLLAPSAQSKGLQVAITWGGPARLYLGDPHRLQQMLVNLIGNAIKFTRQGTIRLEASEVACHGNTATLEFAVSDTGIGIAPDKLQLLFQNFSQVDGSTTRQFGGTGLGLAIVRNLAQLMGGEVGVESDPGIGSRFWFRVRAERLLRSSGLQQTLPATLTNGASTEICARHSARVLVVEDNADHRRLIQILLNKLGFDVLQAENGQIGLDTLVQGEAVAIVLMDLHLPQLDGYAATRKIRQWEQQSGNARHAIIALTADAYEEDRQRCLAAGMDEVLTKPVSMLSLKSMLSRWLPSLAPMTPQHDSQAAWQGGSIES